MRGAGWGKVGGGSKVGRSFMSEWREDGGVFIVAVQDRRNGVWGTAKAFDFGCVEVELLSRKQL